MIQIIIVDRVSVRLQLDREGSIVFVRVNSLLWSPYSSRNNRDALYVLSSYWEYIPTGLYIKCDFLYENRACISHTSHEGN